MKTKEYIITFFWLLLVGCLFAVNYVTNTYIHRAKDVYQVYLHGKSIGFVGKDEDLYTIINKRQKEIKEKYNVDNVYPPEDFQIVKTSSYKSVLSSPEEIYDKISQLDTFTVGGYIVTVKTEDSEFHINVLEREIFDEAINNFVLAFIDYEEYNNYINNTQPVIETTGKNIKLMYFEENLTIKEGFISANEKIYTDVTELSQYLLFGEDYEIERYTIKAGDTIAKISEENRLNAQEFLIANPQYTSEDSLLKIGDQVNITLINPVITFSYEVYEVADQEVPYEKKTVVDNTKQSGYSQITTPGVTGIIRQSVDYKVKNGETQQGAIADGGRTIVEKVDQVTTVGPSYSPIIGEYVDTGTTWQWPTNYPYWITSPFGYRWGTLHEGLDISGTGHGSPIYAAGAGTVYHSGWEGACGSGGGWCVVIAHDNGYYSIYAHMAEGSLRVSTGQRVERGQIIGGMGNSGYSFGTHLHFAVYTGIPWRTGNPFDPRLLWS